MNEYVAPKHEVEAFNCPHCGAFTHQYWFNTIIGQNKNVKSGKPISSEMKKYTAARCFTCKDYSIWLEKHHFSAGTPGSIEYKLIYPNISNFEFPNEDLPEDIKSDFNEARDICNISPRGAAALLRLCIQKLCIHLGLPGKNINDDISALVEKGLPEKIVKAFDIVRIVGNSAVHPAELKIDDDIDTVSKLFKLVNIIADKMISEPKEIDELFEKKVPESKKKGIEERDNKNKKDEGEKST